MFKTDSKLCDSFDRGVFKIIDHVIYFRRAATSDKARPVTIVELRKLPSGGEMPPDKLFVTPADCTTNFIRYWGLVNLL